MGRYGRTLRIVICTCQVKISPVKVNQFYKITYSKHIRNNLNFCKLHLALPPLNLKNQHFSTFLFGYI